MDRAQEARLDGPEAGAPAPLLPALSSAAPTVCPWWRRSLDRVLAFIQAVLQQPSERAGRRRRAALAPGGARALPAPTAARGAPAEEPAGTPSPTGVLVPSTGSELPCDLLLTTGHGAVCLFAAGPIDELCFFQRAGVPEHLEVEFLSRLDPAERGSEDYKPYGMFRLRTGDGQPLPRAGELPEDFWATLYREHGLVKLLPAARVLDPRGWEAWDPRRNGPDAGRNRVVPQHPDYTFKRARGQRYTHADLLEIVRRHLRGPERIAWLEAAFPEQLAPGQIVHRYWLDAARRIWLVRHHWARGKQLHRAHTSEEAKALLIASGALPRRKAA